ncbi:MAG: LapA family protein [Candidatus Aminicenantaceae bacterium]
MKPRIIIILLLVILAIVFIVQNTQVVSVKFLVLDFQMSQIIMIVLMLLIGFFIGYLAASKKKL